MDLPIISEIWRLSRDYIALRCSIVLLFALLQPASQGAWRGALLGDARRSGAGALPSGALGCYGMKHPGLTEHGGRQRRLLVAVMKGAGWNRRIAEARTRALAAEALRTAAGEVLAGRDGRVRALVDRAVRRLGLVADLEER